MNHNATELQIRVNKQSRSPAGTDQSNDKRRHQQLDCCRLFGRLAELENTNIQITVNQALQYINQFC